MIVLKKINNNVALCRDSKGSELIAFGNGIGFPKTPYVLTDLSKIDVTFYNISEQYLDVLNEIPSDIMAFTARMVDRIRIALPYELKPNFVLTLADHLAFCMERQKKNIYVHMPLAYEISSMYPMEVQIAKNVLEEMRRTFDVHLNNREIYGIVLSILNSRIDSEENSKGFSRKKMDALQKKIDAIVEKQFNIKIEHESFSYSRFSSHLQHLFSRINSNKPLHSKNVKLYEKMKKEFPETDCCVEKISDLIRNELGWELSDEEKMYLIIHVNRICEKESV